MRHGLSNKRCPTVLHAPRSAEAFCRARVPKLLSAIMMQHSAKLCSSSLQPYGLLKTQAKMQSLIALPALVSCRPLSFALRGCLLFWALFGFWLRCRQPLLSLYAPQLSN